MDAGGGMSQAAADAKYQAQWVTSEATPTSGQTLSPTSPNGESILLTLKHTGTIATLTINFPSNPKIGQFFELNSPAGAVTTLNLVAPNGTTIMNPQAQLAVGDYVGYRYTTTNVWMRRI